MQNPKTDNATKLSLHNKNKSKREQNKLLDSKGREKTYAFTFHPRKENDTGARVASKIHVCGIFVADRLTASKDRGLKCGLKRAILHGSLMLKGS